MKSSLAGLARDEAAVKVRRCYRLFVRGLLDVTDDTVTDDGVHPPARVVDGTDGPDPYLVVAADKGTAAFSDLANEESADVGYWLDDAFASGGSAGFNHKQLGVTARGAWVAVRRHFTELGIDPERDEITVAGIGDMSGDVFGNGMLLSDTLRVVAAFDHRHVFLDPTPDPKSSFAERARLAALPGSSWADYDPALISPGGGVFPGPAGQSRCRPRCGPRSVSTPTFCPPTSWSRPSCVRRSTCCGTGASAPTSGPRTSRMPTWRTGATTGSASRRTGCDAASSAKAATWA